MTERKPRSDSIESWVERQISDAEKQGAFRDLPGLGKPIPGAGKQHDDSSWLRGYLQRENVPADALLPLPLQLKKEIERLPEELHPIRSETIVRQRIEDLNKRIVDWTRTPVGPRIWIQRVDVEATVVAWRESRIPANPPAPPPEIAAPSPARRRWFGRRRR
ncbi:DnaJ family domain-containing protein [Actinomycetes bacterium M1A6_2h]